MEKLTSWLFAK